MRKTFFITALLLSVSTFANAQDHNLPDVEKDSPLSESELKAVFSGQTHRGTYSFVRKNFTSFGFSETTRADGTTHHEQQGQVDTGNWLISGETLCFKYNDSEHSEFSQFNPICFNIYQRGNCYYHYQVSVKGFNRRGFTARSVLKGETPNCEPSYT